MQISLPVGLLITPFKDKITQYLFLDTIQRSHKEYIDNNGYLDEWVSLGEKIEISLYLPSVIENERTPIPKLAIKTTLTDISIDKIKLLVTSKSTLYDNQDCIQAFNISYRITLISLPSTPLRSCFVSDDGYVFPSINEIRIDLLDENDNIIATTNYMNPSTYDILNIRFKKMWDVYWSMHAIDNAYSTIRQKMHFHLVQQKIYYADVSQASSIEKMKNLLRVTLGYPLYWLASKSFFVKIIFWFPIFLKRKKFNPSKL